MEEQIVECYNEELEPNISVSIVIFAMLDGFHNETDKTNQEEPQREEYKQPLLQARAI